MTAAPNEPVLLRRGEGRVAILTLNREHDMNALSGELIDVLQAEFDSALLVFAGRVPWLGRLPGDIVIRRDDFVFVLPLTTCLLVSALLSLALYLLRR